MSVEGGFAWIPTPLTCIGAGGDFTAVFEEYDGHSQVLAR